MIEPIAAIGTEALAQAAAGEAPKPTGDFSDWITRHVSALNTQIVNVDSEVRRMALGDAGNLHEVMSRLESTKLSFELAVQVRNRLLEAYQEIMRMQI